MTLADSEIEYIEGILGREMNELEEGMQGTIGIIGPKRMDYDKVVGTLKQLMEQLDSLYKKE